ncbi:MAG: hypothetical protein GY822_03810 [Deltaproteobacteria bacterium]|nr:hypothetical protein [Deltaproteobacteria bacterium]
MHSSSGGKERRHSSRRRRHRRAGKKSEAQARKKSLRQCAQKVGRKLLRALAAGMRALAADGLYP